MDCQVGEAAAVLERTPAAVRGLRARLTTLRGWQFIDAQLALEGEHPAFGAVMLRQLLSTWVAHDLGHLAQTSRAMARQYREAVARWRAYLPVLDRRAGAR